jgi:uncharacterized protein YpmB
MKKTLIIVVGIIAVLIVISIVATATNPEAQKSFQSGMEQGRQTVEGK